MRSCHLLTFQSRQRARSRINVLLCHCDPCDPCDPAECVSSEKPGTGPAHRGRVRVRVRDPERSGFCLDLGERWPEVNVQVIPSTSLVTSSRTCTENREQGREAPASCSDHLSPDSDTWQNPSQGGRTRLAPNQADSDPPEASSVVLQVHHSGKRRIPIQPFHEKNILMELFVFFSGILAGLR